MTKKELFEKMGNNEIKEITKVYQCFNDNREFKQTEGLTVLEISEYELISVYDTDTVIIADVKAPCGMFVYYLYKA